MKGWLQYLMQLRRFKRGKSVQGQITTLMVLLLVVVLIFVMATLEIGDTAMKATKMANAADQATLALASSIATRGRYMAESLPCSSANFKCCQKKPFWSIIVGIILVIIAIIIAVCTYGSQSWLVYSALAFLSVPVGTTVANAAEGSPMKWYQATVMGCAMAVAGAVCAYGIVVGAPALAVAISDSIDVILAVFFTASGVIAITTLYTLYSTGLAYNQAADSVNEAIAKMFAQLDDRDRWREQAMYTALSQLVDDPTMVRDTYDVDGNGITNEIVPSFGVFWVRRLRVFIEKASISKSAANTLVTQMKAFKQSIACAYEDGSYCSREANLAPLETVAGFSTNQRVPVLQNSDYRVTDTYEVETTLNGQPIPDGRILRLTRAMSNAGYSAGTYLSLPNWAPGPSASEMSGMMAMDCNVSETACEATPSGYDWLDEIVRGLKDTNDLIGRISSTAGAGDVWKMWIDYFYNSGDPADTNTVYGLLGVYLDVLQNLRTALQYPAAPFCVGGWFNQVCSRGSCVTTCGDCPNTYYLTWQGGRYVRVRRCGQCVDTRNSNPRWPCRMHSSHGFNSFPVDPGITLTERATDVLIPVGRSIDRMVSLMTTFRNQIKTQADLASSASIPASRLSSLGGGVNPMYYLWTDSRGARSVQAEVGEFQIPRTDSSSSWRKSCIFLRDYTDGNRCWVEVTSSEIPNSNGLGILGKWNPFGRSIKKRASAQYTVSYDDSHNSVRLR